jgi:hypothetical protein
MAGILADEVVQNTTADQTLQTRTLSLVQRWGYL